MIQTKFSLCNITLYDVPMHSNIFKVEVELYGDDLKILSSEMKSVKRGYLRRKFEVDPEYFEPIKQLAFKKIELIKGWGIL